MLYSEVTFDCFGDPENEKILPGKKRGGRELKAFSKELGFTGHAVCLTGWQVQWVWKVQAARVL